MFGAPRSNGQPGRRAVREAEVAAATAALTALDRPTRGTRSRVVLEVVGDPGMGKTWLLARLQAAARDQGRLVLAGSARQTWCGLPYRPLAGAVETLLQQELVTALDRAPTHPISPEARRLMGALLSRADIPGEPTRQDARARRRDWMALLDQLARPRGLVVVLDDLHWADTGTVTLIGELLRHPPTAPLLLALAYRPRQVSVRLASMLAAGAAADTVERMVLAPLSLDDAHAFLGPDTDPTAVPAKHAASGGNPRYLAAVAEADTWQLTPGIDGMLGLVTPPTAVRDAIDAELVRLSDNARVVAWAAAVAADTVDGGLLAAVAGTGTSDTSRGIDELLGHDLLRHSGTSPGHRCRHPVVRAVLYAEAGDAWRRAAHLRAATALARRGAGPLVVAHHLARSRRGITPRLAAQLIEAAVPASIAAPAATARLLTEVLGRIPRDGPWSAARDLLCAQLAHALVLSGQLSASRRVTRELLQQPVVRPDARARAVATHAMATRLLGCPEPVSTLRRYEQVALGGGDDAARAQLALERTTTGLLTGDDTGARAAAERAWTDAVGRGDRPWEATARAVGVLIEVASGDVWAATRHRDHTARLVDALTDGELARCLGAVAALGWGEVLLERHDDAARHLHRGLAVATCNGQRHLEPYLFAGIAAARQLAGRLIDATHAADDALAAADTLGSDELRAMALTVRCAIAICGGDRDTAVRAGELAIAAGGTGSGRWLLVAGVARAQARLAAGRPGEAQIAELVRAGGGPDLPAVPSIHRAICYASLVHAELSRGRPAAAGGWLEQMEAAARQTPTLLRPTGYALLARAWLLLASGLPAAARPYAAEAAATFARAGAVLDVGRCQLVTGVAEGRLGQRGRALCELKQAQAVFAQAGAYGLHRGAVRALRRLGHRAHDGAPAPVRAAASPLTRRETEVATLVAAGHTNAEVAALLELSRRTVDAHLRHIFSKLGVANRAALAAAVTRSGVTTPRPPATL